MDIKKDASSGMYQISDAEQVDDTYDLHGLMFEFSRHNEGEVFYQFVQKTKEEICPKPEAAPVEEPKVVVEVKEPEPVPANDEHRKM